MSTSCLGKAASRPSLSGLSRAAARARLTSRVTLRPVAAVSTMERRVLAVETPQDSFPGVASGGNIVTFPTSAPSGSRRTTTQPASPLLPAVLPGPPDLESSSGLDFIDMIYLDPKTARACYDDACTYQMLCGRARSVLRSEDDTVLPGRFNLKTLTNIRDNVTRNLAPVVALACASAVAEAKERKRKRVAAMLEEQRAASGFASPSAGMPETASADANTDAQPRIASNTSNGALDLPTELATSAAKASRLASPAAAATESQATSQQLVPGASAEAEIVSLDELDGAGSAEPEHHRRRGSRGAGVAGAGRRSAAGSATSAWI
ncbi:hypothetical protein HYH03_014325 [Edaphochlamys debaryana]|uniref:Uncharacterized protein n=1 Tax=Edaphochlamys debaryana TaxID=47281 RepID=A0A835XP60_9CHLO|nr:hypothetical protein HYH03_014325 [Edaphochlamys debaryana]|eukprot:KAG2487080.1 hypothetical protein HYH03_014325 [Edaphochlamys debaryana]